MAYAKLRIATWLVGCWVTAVGAQTYPSHPVRIVVPFQAGGGLDNMVRSIAAELSPRWGRPVTIDNRGGAGTLIGAEAVAKAAPDGHTLLATLDFTITSNRFLYRNLPYDPDRSFAPVSLMVQGDQFVIASAALPVKDLRELVAFAKQQRGKINYGSWGKGSQPHMVFELLNHREGLDLLHIPYKGIAPIMTALLSGELQLTIVSGNVAGPLLKADRVKALAIASKRRSAQFPDIPTAIEQGFPSVGASVWYGLFAPSGTPPAIVNKISADVASILRDPAFAEKYVRSRGLDVVASDPEGLQQVIKEEVAAMSAAVKIIGIEPN